VTTQYPAAIGCLHTRTADWQSYFLQETVFALESPASCAVYFYFILYFFCFLLSGRVNCKFGNYVAFTTNTDPTPGLVARIGDVNS
jgi:hypothetical protein